MCDSGDCLVWNFDGFVLDKYFIGGIGDCVLLVFVFVFVVCGVYVLMILGRGLGYIGGMFDKFELIPGLCVDLDEFVFCCVVDEVGVVIVSVLVNIVFVDKCFYVVWDVMVMVESFDLIIVLILFKKFVVGFEYLVFDVKFGFGVLMKFFDEVCVFVSLFV